MHTLYDLLVCDNCAAYIAHGEVYNAYGDEITRLIANKIHANWPDLDNSLVLGDPNDTLNYCTTPCETCGNPLHGNRTDAYILGE